MERHEQQDLTHEGAVSNPFAILLDVCAKKVNATFVTQYKMNTAAGNNIFIDGAVLDEYDLPIAYWEAKDIDDDLQKAISKKRDKGYPFDNILFQTPERAILFQKEQEVLNTDITDPKNCVEVLHYLFSYSDTTFRDWYEAVDKFSDRIPALADKLKNLIDQQHKNSAAYRQAFATFYQTCQASINPDLSQTAVEEMLIQHILTERFFRTVFYRSDFVNRNIIAVEIEKISAVLMQQAVSRDEFLKPLDPFYGAIENAAKECKDFSEKQNFLNTVYERFFQGFSVKVADTHGIVYTPQPIVDFMVKSVSHILETEFGRSLSDSGVHIIDPFVGTGNFIVRLMQDIDGIALQQKYQHEQHCNEILLMPYYIASLNIEQEYYKRTGEYLPFEGIVFADTFELIEDMQMSLLSEENTKRVEEQKEKDMFVVIGNPPYNALQVNQNDNNKNRKYKTMDKRIQDTYADDSIATLKNKLYDPYVRAIRWASDRIGEEGIVAFITNNSFVNQVMFDGMRKHLAQDFDAIYIFDLGGNARKGLKVSDANVFGIRVGVSINFFVKTKQNISETARIHYYRTDEMWNKEKKFNFMTERKHVGSIEWETIEPDARHTWLTEGLHGEYDNFIPMGTKEVKNTKRQEVSGTIFRKYSLGVSTNRDAWVYNFNQDALRNNVQRTIETYNTEVDRWKRHKNVPDVTIQKEEEEDYIDNFVMYDEEKIGWSRDLKIKLKREKKAEYTGDNLRTSMYRPFTKRKLYFARMLIDQVLVFPSIFPTPETEKENRVICVGGYGRKEFAVLMSKLIPNINLYGDPQQSFPFYIYNEDSTNRRENITDWALKTFQNHYEDESITKWDIFHYTYGLLHHPKYREKYQANLKRDLPHIPYALDFWGFANAGAQLADIHVNYESQPKYEGLKYIETPDIPIDWRVEKMKLSKDKTQLKYNDFLTIDGIPAEVYEYQLGTRSALEWVVNQYQVKVDERSGIVNDPNRAEEPRYIVDFIGQVITVSLETVKIIAGLPELQIFFKNETEE